MLAGALLAAVNHGSVAPGGPQLLVFRGEPAGRRFPVRDGALLGRGRTADVLVVDLGASRRHARLRVRGSRIAVEDLGSKNGLTVNGRTAAHRPVALRHGDRIAIGETILLVEDEGHPPGPGTAWSAPQALAGLALSRDCAPRLGGAAILLAGGVLLAGAAALLAVAGAG